LERDYPRKNPYHNSIHAADVALSLHFLLHKTQLIDQLKPIELLAALVAAIIHDFKHPGMNNAFEIATQSTLALTYNDMSV
jgi:hypothetical protein